MPLYDLPLFMLAFVVPPPGDHPSLTPVAAPESLQAAARRLGGGLTHLNLALEPVRPLLSGPPLFEGCRLRYLDLGTNAGYRIRSLFSNLETNPLPGQDEFLFAGENRSEVCAVGFEPNPQHAPRLARLQDDMRGRGHRVTILGAAISTSNGTATFWSAT